MLHGAQVSTAVFSPDGSHIVTASVDRTASVWRVDDPVEPLVLRGHEGRVIMAVFSHDGASIVTGSADGTARVWNHEPRRLQQAIASSLQACLSARFRSSHPGESPEEALRNFEQCEGRPGRMP